MADAPVDTKLSPDGDNPNPHHARGKGCLRAQTALGESISVCRKTQEGAWDVEKPLQEDIAITVEVVRDGSAQTLATAYSDAHTSAGAGDMIRLVVNGSCATPFTASEIDPSGSPAWKSVADSVAPPICFSGALTLQGVTAEGGDVLFVGTKNGSSYVAGSGLTFGGGDYALEDLSFTPPLTYVGGVASP